MTLGARLPALAGVDFQALELARKAQRAQESRTKAANLQEHGVAKASPLPLDHGPRAQSTQYLNRERMARSDASITFNARS